MATAKEDVTAEEQNEFHRIIFNDYLDPLSNAPLDADGDVDVKSILSCPRRRPST